MSAAAFLDPPEAAVLSLLGHHAPGRPPPCDLPGLAWTDDPLDLFAPGTGGYIVADPAALPATVLPLLAARPTLFVVRDRKNVAVLTRLVRERTVIATPADAVVRANGCAFGDILSSALHGAVIDDALAWVARRGTSRAPRSLPAFGALSKSECAEIARRTAALPLPRTQQFWRPLGDVECLAPLLMRTECMVRVDVSPHLANVTPSLVVVAANDAGALGALTPRQSTVLVAPFALRPGEPIDHVLGKLSTACAHPFALHELIHFGDVGGTGLGCVYGEFIL